MNINDKKAAMKRVLVFMFSVVVASVKLSAQNYNWAMGVRLGDDMGGITAKVSISANEKIEGILAIPYWHGTSLTGLYQRYIPLGAAIQFYYGIGGHVGNWKDKNKHKYDFFLGADAIAGIEYVCASIPLSFSFDYKPTVNFTGHFGFNTAGGGISVRYLF